MFPFGIFMLLVGAAILEKPAVAEITNSDPSSSGNIFSDFWEWRMNNAPEFATFVGVYKYDDRLDEMSLNSYTRREVEIRNMLEKAKQLPSSEDLELLKVELGQYLEGQKYQSYLFPMNMLEGPHLDFPRLISWMKMDTKVDVEKQLKRMRGFEQQIEETIYLMRTGIRLGKTMHKISVQTLPKVFKTMAEEPVQKSPVFKPFVRKRPAAISKTDWESLVNEAAHIVKTIVQPTYLRLSVFLNDIYLYHTRPHIGASTLPNGIDFYKGCLKYHTTTNLTPKEIHDIGLKEVARITKRLEQVKEAVEFKGTLEQFRNHLRTDPKFNYSNGDEIVSNYKNKGKHIHSLLPKIFSVMPKAPYVITPIPIEVAASFPGAYYLAPSADGRRPGTFFINVYKPETRKRYEAVALSLHEAEPGHHLQGALSIEHGSPYAFRRFGEDRKYYEAPSSFPKNTAYIEGWGLYAEYLGEELGVYKSHYDMAGRLSHEMFRACRLVVDTGIHAFGWSRDQAITFMKNNAALALHDIQSEVDRYITWPGQACGYKIGEIKLKALRKKATDALGDKFDLRVYHTFIASMGAVPLDFLEAQVDEFIKKHKN